MADLVSPRIRGTYVRPPQPQGHRVVGAGTILTAVILDQANHPLVARWLAPPSPPIPHCRRLTIIISVRLRDLPARWG